MILSLTLASLIAQQPGGGVLVPDWEVSTLAVLGRAVPFAAPDIDQDGTDDWLLSYPSAYSASTDFGATQLRSGRDGSILWQQDGIAPEKVEFVDLDADGQFEILVSDRESQSAPSRLVCMNAILGVTLWEVELKATRDLGQLAWFAQDLNGDGFQEVLLSDDDAAGQHVPTVQCRNFDGSLRWEDRGIQRSAGHVQVRFEDLDADGKVDVLFAESTFYSASGPYQEGRIRRLDAASGAVLWDARSGRYEARLGSILRTIDLDDDGVLEVLSVSAIARWNGLKSAGAMTALDAAGSVLWEVGGFEAEQRLGESYVFGDFNADSIADLIVGLPHAKQSRGAVVAFDGVTGAEVWRAENRFTRDENFGGALWFAPASGSGDAWLAIQAARPRGFGDVVGINFRNARSGASISSFLVEAELTNKLDAEFFDADADSVPELFFANGRGRSRDEVGVIHPHHGVLWQTDCPNLEARFTLAATVDRPARVITTQRKDRSGIGYAGEIRCFDAISGKEIWSESGKRDGQSLGYNAEIDFAKNGEPWLRVGSNSATGNTVRIYHRETGELLTVFGNVRHEGNDLVWSSDSDRDGASEILMVGPRSIVQYPATLKKRGFLKAQGSLVSVAHGGGITLQLDFSPRAAWLEYRVIAAAHGPGTSYSDELIIPLQYDRLLGISLANRIPGGIMKEASGALNQFGKAAVDVEFQAGQIPIGMVGRSLDFCALARVPFGPWQYCSVPINLKFTP